MITIALLLAVQSEATGEPAMHDGPMMVGEVAQEASADVRAAADEIIEPVKPTAPVIDIPRDTPVHLMVLTEVSTRDHDPGHRFRLRVNKPVIANGNEVIPVGAIAWGELLSAEKSGNLGKSGKLSARLLHIEHDGREIALDGEAQSEGKSGKGETILGVLAAGPLGLFARGNNAKLKAGEKMTAFIAEDVSFAGDLPAQEPIMAAAQEQPSELPQDPETPPTGTVLDY
ncbi:MAG: hypothetical protein AAGK17_09655 [Pseudomonadota bacterium]